jgi:acyl carrier protein
MDSTALVREFVQRRFPSPSTAAIDRQTPLFSSGLVDSFGVLELIAFLEDTFGITIDTARHDLLEFDTIEKIDDVIRRERDQP